MWKYNAIWPLGTFCILDFVRYSLTKQTMITSKAENLNQLSLMALTFLSGFLGKYLLLVYKIGNDSKFDCKTLGGDTQNFRS